MQVIGLCRFSYVGHGGFQITHDSLEERIAFLYADSRLEERFRFFETITLPCIRAQTDPDFTFLIVIGDSFPKAARAKLDKLTRDIPQVVIQTHAPGRHRRVMRDAINSVRYFDEEPCLQFRLDDDDAVAVSYVEKLRAAAAQVAGLLRDVQHVAIDYNQGFIACPGSNGIEATAIQEPYWTPGLGMLLSAETDMCVMNFAHWSIVKYMPTLTFTGEDMMLRGQNNYNDSYKRKWVKSLDLAPLDRDEEQHFRETYNIDANHVRQVFSA